MAIADLWRLDGQVALVVGGSGGMGVDISAALAESGARVALTSSSQAKADATVAQLAARGQEAVGHKCDVTRKADVTDLVARVVDRLGQIDVLVNCAGINIRRLAADASEEDWVKVVDTNLVGAFRIAQAVGKHMIGRRHGKIVTISSTRGALGFPGGYTAYCSSKAGVNMLTKQLATEWAQHGVYVNAIAPTYIDTPIIAALKADEQLHQTILHRIPLGRLGQPQDLVGAVLFLSTSASNFVTGQVLYVDGGITATEFYKPVG
jgi:NAD(P)-dependent dehydrogenase (short-subunit alcohol dehydrogenase family)